MPLKFRWWTCLFSLLPLIPANAGATSVPRLTFEELIDHSELVVAGQITRSWSDWDSEHKFIWTHYELSVANVEKGTPQSLLVISEPGGVAGSRGMTIAGAVQYRPGERVAVFLQRMPNGYLRTTGWSQGKYVVSRDGRLHGQARLGGLEIVPTNRPPATAGRTATPLTSLEGVSLSELQTRVAAHVAAQGRTNPGRTNPGRSDAK